MSDSNLEMYADPINYDLESGPFELAGSILPDLAAAAAGPILELGCGTGRVTIPLAQKGFEMTGLDILPHMIVQARVKAAGLPIQWVIDDVRSFHLDQRFPLIFTRGAVFQHLLEQRDQEAMLARVREHLAPGGRFLLDIGFKTPSAMVDVVEEQDWYTYTDIQGREVTLSGTDQYDPIKQIWYQKWTRRWSEKGVPKSARPETLALRYFMPQEMEALLTYNGFTLLSRYGDWDGSPMTGDSYLQIYLCA